MGVAEGASMLAAFASAFEQRDRLLRLRFGPAARAFEQALLPERLAGREALHECYRFELECLSADASLDLARLVGEPIEVGVRTASSRERLVGGIVSAARALGSDGGFARYALTIEPVLALLAHQRLARVFQGKSVPAIVTTILDEHIARNDVIGRAFRVDTRRLQRTYPPRSYCTAYRETARAFIERLLAEEAIGWTFVCGDPEANANEPPVHTLVLFDDGSRAIDVDLGDVRFHEPRMAEPADGHTAWQRLNAIASGATRLASVDYKRARRVEGGEATRSSTAGALAASLEDYEPQSAYYAADGEELASYAARRQAAIDAGTERFGGAGTLREAIVGGAFVLAEHPVHARESREERSFVFTALTLEAESNLPKALAESLPGSLRRAAPKPGYRNEFEAQRRGTPLVPRFAATEHARPTARGMQIATVVGPRDEAIYTDALGRIRIQFPWQRSADHPEGTAHQDERASTWIRVMMPAAGDAFGHQFIPRIGHSVVVDFIESDVDRPIVVGVVYDGAHAPPRFAGKGALPENRALSGVRSREIGGERASHLLFDDTTGELRAQLATDHRASEINLGYLTTARDTGRAEPRGEGIEARTDGAAAIRAAQGLLLTASQRAEGVGTQLAREEIVRQLRAALELVESLGTAAADAGGEPTALEPQRQLGRDVEHWHRGSNVDRGGARDTSGSGPGPSGIATPGAAAGGAGGAPLIVAGAPGGIVLSTPECTTVHAGKSLDLASERDANLTAARHWIANAGQKASVFVAGVARAISLRLTTARGDIRIAALSDDVTIHADRSLKLMAGKEQLFAQAERRITLTCGGAHVTLEGGNILLHAPGRISMKAADFDMAGPARLDATPAAFEPGEFQRQFTLVRASDGKPVPDVRYEVTDETGVVASGTSNAAGTTTRREESVFKRLAVRFFRAGDGSR
jgi:type VI secretion system secreted protein VgrG